MTSSFKLTCKLTDISKGSTSNSKFRIQDYSISCKVQQSETDCDGNSESIIILVCELFFT